MIVYLVKLKKYSRRPKQMFKIKRTTRVHKHQLGGGESQGQQELSSRCSILSVPERSINGSDINKNGLSKPI